MEPSEQKALNLAVLRLQPKFHAVPAESIRNEAEREYRHYDGSPVRS